MNIYTPYTVVLCESSIEHRLLAKNDEEAIRMAKNGRFTGHDYETVLFVRNDYTNEFVYGDGSDYYLSLEEMSIHV